MPEPRLFDKRGKYFLNIVGTSGIVRQLHTVSSLAIAVARVNPATRLMKDARVRGSVPHVGLPAKLVDRGGHGKWVVWCSPGPRSRASTECGRMVLNQWTHSAVATTGGVDVLPRALVADQLGLVQEVQSLGQGKAERSRPSTPPRRPPRTRPGQLRSE